MQDENEIVSRAMFFRILRELYGFDDKKSILSNYGSLQKMSEEISFFQKELRNYKKPLQKQGRFIDWLLKDPIFISELQSYKADLQVVVAFRMLPEIVWNMPPKGTLNLHASLLPDYRGAAPINHAIINGETETGVTTFFLQHAIDTGDIIFSEKMNIDPDEDAGSLHDKLMELGAKLIVKTVSAIQENNYVTTPQSGISNKTAPKIFKETCQINW
ncbi:MAG: methionyl-tRNA formyltransferase, partial [Candidatus Woesebacteria bacterium]|nr:methionyl-tRNA formyltransferase [Candidatus Woesebacteria bacterium]